MHMKVVFGQWSSTQVSLQLFVTPCWISMLGKDRELMLSQD